MDIHFINDDVLQSLTLFLSSYKEYEVVECYKRAIMYKEKISEMLDFIGDKPKVGGGPSLLNYNSQLASIIKELAYGM